MAHRLAGRYGYPKAPNEFKVTYHIDRIEQPQHWLKPRLIFVCSMSDLFHEDVPNALILSVFRTMHSTPQHTYQVLTKRPERMKKIRPMLCQYLQPHNGIFDNVWLGVTAENQEQADKRIPLLLDTPAAVRFISIEPMLGPIDLDFGEDMHEDEDSAVGCAPCEIGGQRHQHWHHERCLRKLHWVIVGGETGPGARPMHPDWVRSVRDQCKAAGVPFFFKGWGQFLHVSQSAEVDIDPDAWNECEDPQGFVRVKNKKTSGRLLDCREHNEMPTEAHNV